MEYFLYLFNPFQSFFNLFPLCCTGFEDFLLLYLYRLLGATSPSPGPRDLILFEYTWLCMIIQDMSVLIVSTNVNTYCLPMFRFRQHSKKASPRSEKVKSNIEHGVTADSILQAASAPTCVVHFATLRFKGTRTPCRQRLDGMPKYVRSQANEDRVHGLV